MTEDEQKFWDRIRKDAEGHVADVQPPSALKPEPKANTPSAGQAPKKGLSRTAFVAASALTILALVVGVLSFGNSPIPTSNGGNTNASAGQTAAPDSPAAQSPAQAEGKATLASVDSCNPVTLDPNVSMNVVSPKDPKKAAIDNYDEKFIALKKDPRGLPLVEAQLQVPDAMGNPMVKDLPKIPDVQSLFTQQGDQTCLSPLAVQVYNTTFSYFLGDNPAVVNRTVTEDPIPADYKNTGIDPVTGEPVRSDQPATCNQRALHASIQLVGFEQPLNTYDCKNCGNPQLWQPPAAIRVVEIPEQPIYVEAPPPVVIAPPVYVPPPVFVPPPYIPPPIVCGPCGCGGYCPPPPPPPGPPPCRFRCGPPPCRDHCGPPPCRDHCGPPPCPNGLCPKPPSRTPTGPNMPGQNGHRNADPTSPGPFQPTRPDKPTSPVLPPIHQGPPPPVVAPEIHQAPRPAPIPAPAPGVSTRSPGGGGGNTACPPMGCSFGKF